MLGCVDAEQGQATGQHRPGGFGKREPGTVGGRGFLVAARKHGGHDSVDGIGDGDEMPGQTVGRAVCCRTGEDTGVVGEDGEKPAGVVALRACYCCGFYFYFYVTGLGVKPRSAALRLRARVRAWA